MRMTMADALRLAREQGIERLDAQLLLGHVAGLSRAALITREQDELSPLEAQTFIELLKRRADQVPLAYLTGRREFHGLSLIITPDVLDPRPDTETLVDWALDILSQGCPGPDPQRSSPALPCQVLDLGTGSGAIALAIQAGLERQRAMQPPEARMTTQVHALDASAAALQVAQANARELQLPVTFHQGDWWAGWQGPRLHLVVSNPPYIHPDDPHLQALRHEPLMALTPSPLAEPTLALNESPGSTQATAPSLEASTTTSLDVGVLAHVGDGLDAIRRIVQGAPAHLHAGAWLLLEHGHDQAAEVAALLQQAGFERISHRRDLAGHTRCTGGCWSGAAASQGEEKSPQEDPREHP